MKRFLGSLQRRSSSTFSGTAQYPDDSPEARIINEVNAFCASGPDPGNTQGTEFVHLPAIVENAESSPSAAKEAAVLIRKLLSDPAGHPPFVLYNAIMLVRILVDNPGHTFTRNLDAKFVSTVKNLLRNARDMGVQHFLRETLNAFEAQRSWDENLNPLLQMWGKEKNKSGSMNSSDLIQPPSSGRTLPGPEELSARISEAKTSAKLLIQFVESTPVAEAFDNELMKEFSDRCRSASRSVQTYIHSTDPAPDEDTLTTLIEANDELSVALSKYHNAILKARKATGQHGTPPPSPSNGAASATALGARQPPPPLPRRDTQSPPGQPAPATVSAPAPEATMSATGGMPSTGGSDAQFPAVPQRDTQSPPVITSTAPVQAPTPVSPTSPASATRSLPSTGAGRYEYRSEDFQVQNPFADDYATEMRSGETRNTQRPAERA